MKALSKIRWFAYVHRPAGIALVCAGLMAGCELPDDYVSETPAPTTADRASIPAAAPQAQPATPPGPTMTLHQATERGDIAQILWHHQIGTDLNAWNSAGMAPIHIAVTRQQNEALEVLLRLKADANRLDASGSSALHFAARLNHEASAAILILNKADNTVKDAKGQIPRQVAMRLGHRDIATVIGPAKEDPPPHPTVAIEPEPEPVIEVVAPVEPEPEPTDEAPVVTAEVTGDFRIWTSASRDQLEAEFVEINMDVVFLKTKDGRILRIPINQLRSDDQVFARQLARNQSQARSSAPQVHGLSVGLRIARQPGWTVLEDAKFFENEQSRADLILVEHQGKKHWFRPYFVESAATSWEGSGSRRLTNQMRYWRMGHDDIMEVGKAATDQAGRYLLSTPFRIITKWDQANLPNEPLMHYAIIWTRDGDYDEWLVARGLASITGVSLDGPLGREKRTMLDRAEKAASDAKAGIWAFQAARR